MFDKTIMQHPILSKLNELSVKDRIKNTNVILESIETANCFDKQEVALYLIAYIESELITRIVSKENLFSEHVSTALSAVSIYRPALAFQRLENELGKEFKLTKDIFNEKNYETLLYILEGIATDPRFFEFGATRLLWLAASEVKLGIYHANHKALHHFKALFTNACARTKVNLYDRKNYLDNFVKAAELNKDYYRLYVLMKTMGTAANVFESGEYNYTKDEFFEAYIYFAIDILMRYAGNDDEDGLCFTAEEELHGILKLTINEPEIWGASDVPFQIFKFFLEAKKEWDISPFYHLNDFNNFIQYLRNEESELDEEYIQELELRLQQLISFVADREFLSEDFILYLGSKREEKCCEIGVEEDVRSLLELHARQSLAERLIFVGKTNLHDIDRDWPKTTYIIANFGMVMSDQPPQKGFLHKRIFKTIPINVPQYIITGRERYYDGHAEEALYDYLLKDDNIASCFVKFDKYVGFSMSGHKIYAVILDLHGTYDMCLSCSKQGLIFQNAFRQKLLEHFSRYDLKTLTKFPKQLPIVIRYSSDIRYHYPNNAENKKQGVLTVVKKEGTKRDLGAIPTSEPSHYVSKRDIKYYGANLLIHGKENWHSFWSTTRRKEYTGKPIPLESWSAFTTDSNISFLSKERKKIKYTRLGEVETVSNTADSLKFSKLSI